MSALDKAAEGGQVTGYAYRLVVDKFPTPNGEPFVDQSEVFWDDMIDRQINNNYPPDWLPDLKRYSPHLNRGAFYDPPKYTRWIGDPEDPEVGWSGSTTIHVPISPKRRFFTRAVVVAMCKQLIEWGCAAHVERAALSPWRAEGGE